MPLEIGADVEGKVTGITKFGAFVELPEGKVGLVHISQISETYITDISKHLRVGDIVRVRALAANNEGKYDLSIKQCGKPAWEERPKKKNEDQSKPAPGSFEDKITNFLKQSEEKLSDWKRHIEYKQTGKKKARIK